MTRRLWLTLAVAAASGCTREPTEALVVVSTMGLRVPDHLDGLRVRVSAKTEGVRDERYDHTHALCTDDAPPAEGCLPLPVSFTIVPGPERSQDSVLVEIDALLAGRAVIADAATFTFVPNTRLRLDFVLYERCLSRLDCAAGELACGPDGTCVPIRPTPFEGAADLNPGERSLPPPRDLAAGDLAPDDLAPPADLAGAGPADMTVGCSDGVRNGQETDVDCGGPVCQKCALAQACALNTDCATGNCLALACASGPSWLPGPNMLGPRYTHRVEFLGNRFYVIGGAVGGTTAVRTVEAFVYSTQSWISSPDDLLATRFAPASAVGSDGRIYAFGGSSPMGAMPLVTAEAYTGPPANTWASIASMPAARSDAAAAPGPDGRLYVIGGHATVANGSALATTFAYTLGGGWATVMPMRVARASLAAATGADGRIYAIGGDERGDSQGAVSTVEAYTVAPANAWVDVASLNVAQRRAAAVAAPDGRLYAIGGSAGMGSPATTLSSVEAYSITANAWSSAASLNTPRMNPGAAISPDGHIWVFGGGLSGGMTVHSTTEIFGPRPVIMPASAQASATVAVSGDNFASNATVNVYLPDSASTPAATGTTDAAGRMAPVQVVVPALAAGIHRVRVVDTTSNYPILTDITVLP